MHTAVEQIEPRKQAGYTGPACGIMSYCCTSYEIGNSRSICLERSRSRRGNRLSARGVQQLNSLLIIVSWRKISHHRFLVGVSSS